MHDRTKLKMSCWHTLHVCQVNHLLGSAGSAESVVMGIGHGTKNWDHVMVVRLGRQKAENLQQFSVTLPQVMVNTGETI